MGNVEIALTALFALLVVGCVAAFWLGRMIALGNCDERANLRRTRPTPDTCARLRRKTMFETKQAD